MESVFNLLAWSFVELLLVGTGRALVRLLTLGRWGAGAANSSQATSRASMDRPERCPSGAMASG